MRAGVVVGMVAVAASSASARPLAQDGWQAIADRSTGTPAQLWGQHAAPGAVRDATIAEGIARRFLAEHIAELAPGAAASDFVVVANRLDDDLRTIGLAQTSRGVPVLGGQIGFVFGRDRLFAILSTAYPNVNVAPLGARAILPVVHGRTITYHAVKIVETKAPGSHWHIYVDGAGREVGRKSRIMTESATLQYMAPVRYPGGGRTGFPAPHASITVDGTAATTGATGMFSWTGAATATIVPGLAGPYVRVIDPSHPLATASLTAQDAQPLVWDQATSPISDAQLSAYVHASIAKARARQVDPAVAAWLDARLDTFVNETFTVCNAYSTGDDIHFLVGGTYGGVPCENTARIADVVYHEFAHSLHFHSLIPGVGDWEEALSEGIADFFAALITGDSGLGRGFFLNANPMRELDPIGSEAIYPQSVHPDPHITGLIIGGALWDLREALLARLGPTEGTAAIERILAGIMRRAPSIPMTYTAALVADDDDANLANGTPNICAINTAFAAHGLFMELETTKVGPARVDGLAIEVPVTVPVACLAQLLGVDVTWTSSAGGSGTFALSSQGPTWTGAFPDQPAKSVLTYSIVARFADGSTRTLPDNPADPAYQRFIGTPTPIWCANMDQPPAWKTATAVNNVAWTWGPPQGGMDPDGAHTGTHVFGTVLEGDGLYLPNNLAYAETPVMDLAGYQNVRLQYWRWLTAEHGGEDTATIVVRPEAVIATTQTTEVWRNHGELNHVDREWRFHDVDLSAFTEAGPLYLRWVLKTSAGTDLGGWNLDDVCVVTADDAVCGDQEIADSEQCDDGNREDGDGCSKLCQTEGGCCSASSDPRGPLLFAGLLGLWFWRRRRP